RESPRAAAPRRSCARAREAPRESCAALPCRRRTTRSTARSARSPLRSRRTPTEPCRRSRARLRPGREARQQRAIGFDELVFFHLVRQHPLEARVFEFLRFTSVAQPAGEEEHFDAEVRIDVLHLLQ